MTADVRSSFLAEITRSQPMVTRAVLGALGVIAAEGDDPSVVCPPINGYWSEYTEQLMTMTVISANRLIRFEMSVSGASLTTCIPLERVRRVAEASENGSTTVVIELEAEPVEMRLSGNVTDGTLAAEGSLLPGGIVLAASGAPAAGLMRFAALMRAALAVY